jgi:CoA:oxalate CoA-transferase
MGLTNPLAGTRVLDLTRVIAGPHCTRLLADLGADVIKLEPPAGDQVRATGARGEISSPLFVQLNSGKRMISVDLGVTESRRLVRQLIEHVDVVIENFRPGVMAEWQLDYPSLASDMPGLIYVSISGYGQGGSWQDRRAYAPFVHAETGYLDTVAELRRAPLEHDPASVADLASAKDATIAVLAALLERERTGKGQFIDIALAHSMLYWNEFASGFLNPGHRRPKSGSTPQTIFVSADGHGFSAGNPVSGQVFAALCRAFSCRELILDDRFVESFGRRERRQELIETLQAAVEQCGGIADIEAALEAEGLAVGRVRKVADIPDAEWAIERGAIISAHNEAGDPILIPNSPWISSASQVPSIKGVGRIGADNGAVLRDLLGLSGKEIASLTSQGVLSSPPSDRSNNRSPSDPEQPDDSS